MKWTERTLTLRFRALLAGLAIVLLAAGCAMPKGPLFAGLQAVPAGKAHVYVYRKWALFSAGAASQVNVDGHLVASIPNASYVLLVLDPGLHSINAGGLLRRFPSTLLLHLEAGRNYFLQYDVSQSSVNMQAYGATVRDVRWFGPRPQPQALEDLADLKRAE